MKIIRSFFFSILIVSTVSAQDVSTVMNSMFESLAAAKTYEYTLTLWERNEDGHTENVVYTKLNKQPRKIYVDNISGENEGIEVLYVNGERNNKVLVSVMWGLEFSPFNLKVRKKQHHTILEIGFDMLEQIIKDAEKRAKKQDAYETVFSLDGKVEFDGRSCYKVRIEDPTFSYTNYTIQGDETLYDISLERNVCEYLIIEKNDQLKNFDSAKPNMNIQIPTSYAKKTVLYIDAENFHPIYQEMHDEKGVFERYEFRDLQIDPVFSSQEFSEDYKEYNF